jgi:hypothetical protein
VNEPPPGVDLDTGNLMNKVLNGIAWWLHSWLRVNMPADVTDAELKHIVGELFWRLIHWGPFELVQRAAGWPDLWINCGDDHVVAARMRVNGRRPSWREAIRMARPEGDES